MDIVDGQPPPRAQLRAADTDRERVVEQLRSAHAEGRLDLAEYDDRIRQAWAARTYGELDLLTADLPAADRPPAASQSAFSPAGSQQGQLSHQDRRSQWRGGARRRAVAGWLSISVINLVIWAIVSLTTLSWIYPWWIWVAGPLGAALLGTWLTDRAAGAKPPR